MAKVRRIQAFAVPLVVAILAAAPFAASGASLKPFPTSPALRPRQTGSGPKPGARPVRQHSESQRQRGSALLQREGQEGALIPSLTKTDFQVLEDSKPQTIKYFTAESDLP